MSSRGKKKNSTSVDDMGPENYLNAMSQPMYGFSSARVDVINPSNLYHVEVIPGLLPPEVPGQVQ